jgi:adenylate cyclase
VDLLRQHQITVLLVDDQAMIGEAVRRMLENEPDIKFHFCNEPTTALAVASTVSPTVILQDLVMPQIDGLTLVRYFRTNPHTRDIPLIVLSTTEDARIKADAFALGANDYIVKLPDRLELIARIRYHSRGYIAMLERNEAFEALLESQKQLEVRNRFIRETFGRYLSDEIVSTILETPEGLTLGGEKRVVTIMMTDLRGFTAMSESLSPESVVRIINNYLETMTEIIVRHHGTIDEFIGDAILVIFGAPVAREDDAVRAVACALEMQLGMAEVNRRNAADGLPAVEMGIGLNTGEVVVGNIGSSRRIKYGVVGSSVNLTSRIESQTLGNQILISRSTRDAVGKDLLEIVTDLEASLKGMRDPIAMYDVRGLKGDYNLSLVSNLPPLKDLADPLPIRFQQMHGKRAEETLFDGQIVQLSEREALIISSAAPEPLSNVRIEIAPRGVEAVEGVLYAKVVPQQSNDHRSFRVRFTSLPDSGATNYLRRLSGTAVRAKS